VGAEPLDESYRVSPEVEDLVFDLKDKESCYLAAEGVRVFQVPAEMLARAPMK
jgi:hypothetical protein